MTGPKSSYETLAREAEARIVEARASGAQLTFLPDEPGPAEASGAKRGKGRATSQLRDYLAAKGLRLPEDVLIEMAGMASTEDAFITAMARTEQLLAWAQDGATGYKGSPVAPSMAQRLDAFKFVFTAQLRAAEALLPYGLGKVTPDVAAPAPVQVFVAPGSSVQAPPIGPDTARDITPKPQRLRPPPLPHEIQRNQGLASAPAAPSDASDRTKRLSD